MRNLKHIDSHFAFGENWSEYAQKIDTTRIEEVKRGLLRLLEKEEIQGKTFLDIGCGSGVHSLAALNLGAASVLAIDIDTQSVETTRRVLKKYAPNSNYEVMIQSVFDLSEGIDQRFDIVYSWGVLHHTGDMYQAIIDAASMVRPGGLFALALYRKNSTCGVWKYIKRWYAHTNKKNQRRARKIYLFLKKLRFELARKDFEEYKENYYTSRGMSFEHDVHDWLGGYPYESITPQECDRFVTRLGFTPVRSNVYPSGFGFFGSGCDEFVYQHHM